MIFEIDVSGEDILTKNYTICIANREGIIKGFKLSENIVYTSSARYGQGQYRYRKSKKGKTTFKVGLYCIILYYLFKSLSLKGDLSLNICKDFFGRENDIKKNLQFFLESKLSLNLKGRMYFVKLENDSNAHTYAFLMRHDNKNKMDTYINITLEDIEQWLR